MVKEVVFDETELENAYLSDDDAIRAAVNKADTSGHPGFPHEVVCTMLDARYDSPAYPRQPLLRFDRIREDGEILHPYAAVPIEKDWVIKLYLPFTAEWAELPEAVFVRLPISTSADIKRRSQT